MSRARFPGHAHFQTFPEIDSACSLIGPGDPPPWMSYNDHGSAPVLLVADHASPFFPAAMNQLGLADWVLERHVAWDIGVDELVRALADELDAQAVLAGFSRLIVDPNRQPDDPGAFPEISDGIAIPGNIDLNEAQKAQRIGSFFKPYHDAISERLEAFQARGITPALIAVHTCTPEFDRIVRPWHIGISHWRNPRFAALLLEALRRTGDFTIGDNEPYPIEDNIDYTIPRHGEGRGLPSVMIEIRQDQLLTSAGATDATIGNSVARIGRFPRCTLTQAANCRRRAPK